ncbi:HAMP domain-containing histidine kinase [Shewanella sp. SNU WT4]|uniref:sensor histidine kinase n=1 Tax=Shewanella sp. SNU WT4 TaxID=2590015 RepID=UPI00112E11BB|nr:HAMP domain-containing sensor histidine kinase [Shewanella sp. SNU WT4]QDF68382.1 HAMP domain-containing histidine kinase [Shewanella sp. SNU WT4]
MTIIIGTLLFSLYRQLVIEQQHQLEFHLQSEYQRYQELADTVNRQNFAIQVSAPDPNGILVAWEDGDVTRGALSFLPEHLPFLPETREFPILTLGHEKLNLYRGGLLNTRYGDVLIASRTDQLATLINKFLNAATWAVMFTIVVTLAAGYLFSKALLMRLVQYNKISQKIQQGQYDKRLPISRQCDEIDVLANQFNTVLDAFERNLLAVRGVTDNIAHDLRTPLSHIRIGIEKLATTDTNNIAEDSAILLEELDNCLATFNAMLSITRIEEGQQQLELQPLNLHELCADLLDMAQAVAEDRDQTLSFIGGDDYSIKADKYLLFTALFNLVDNAIKYAGDGARIEIIQQGNLIQICDNGPGIPDEAKDKVFDRLVRLDPSRHHAGTGLGLSMVKAILSRHHAIIELTDNHPGLIVSIRF